MCKVLTKIPLNEADVKQVNYYLRQKRILTQKYRNQFITHASVGTLTRES